MTGCPNAPKKLTNKKENGNKEKCIFIFSFHSIRSIQSIFVELFSNLFPKNFETFTFRSTEQFPLHNPKESTNHPFIKGKQF